jgi:hypothetical protein
MKKNNKNNIYEELGIKLARNFYASIQLINDDIMKNPDVSDDAKKELFRYSLTNFDDLDEYEKRYIEISASCGLQSGVVVLQTLMSVAEQQKEDEEEGEK